MPAQVYWYTQKEIQRLDPLPSDDKADVAIIGGGMAGLTCAQKCIQSGMSVILLEKDFCGAGASGRTSGFVTPDSEIELSSLISHYGPDEARRIWEFVLSGVEIIRQNITAHHIDCDYLVQDSLFIANSNAGLKHVTKEHEARHGLGYASTHHNRKSIQDAVASEKYFGGVQYPDTFGINSFLYCQVMRDALQQAGVKIYEQTRVTGITEGTVHTAAGTVRANAVIVCADRFIPDFGKLVKEIYHVQTFLGLSKPLADGEMAKIFPADKLMVWDTNLVYNYFRATGQNRLLIGGGDLRYTYAHTLATDTERFRRRLTRYIGKKFPAVAIELEYVWPGMLGVSKDLLPIMGPDPSLKNTWYVGAATGLPWAAALGFYAAEKITADRNDFDDRFSWQRKFILGRRLQTLVTTPLTYAMSNGIAKYF